MNPPPVEPPWSERAVDEAVDESFPASDAPAWNPIHAGAPPRPPGPAGHHSDLQSQILAHLEQLGRRFDPAHRVEAREDLVAQALLAAGCTVTREPLQGAGGVRNLEAEVLGVERAAPCVVVGARYDGDDATRVALFLALVRASVAAPPARRTVRFAAFADAPSVSGPMRYAEGLAAAGVRVHALITLGTLALPREVPSIVFAFGWRQWSLGSTAGKAFRRASTVRARVRPFIWWPGRGASDYAALAKKGIPAVTVADFRGGRRGQGGPNIDRMAATAVGLVASVRALADAGPTA